MLSGTSDASPPPSWTCLARLSMAFLLLGSAAGCHALHDASRDPVAHARNRYAVEVSGTDRSGSFVFLRDTPGLTNETVWEYRIDPATGIMTSHRRPQKPTFSQHCFPVARLTKQFHLHATFEPSLPSLSTEEIAGRIREVGRRTPRKSSDPEQRILLPGFAGLRELSEAMPGEIRRATGGRWRSYLQRGNWRMVFPFTRSQQVATSRRLATVAAAGFPTVIHVVNFPALKINHALLVYGASKSTGGVEFAAYDPNTPGHPVVLQFTNVQSRFFFPPQPYFSGGWVDVYPVFSDAFH